MMFDSDDYDDDGRMLCQLFIVL